MTIHRAKINAGICTYTVSKLGSPVACNVLVGPVLSYFYTLETMRGSMYCKLVLVYFLVTNRKSRTGFPLVPKAVTLNDLEPRNGRNFASFHTKR